MSSQITSGSPVVGLLRGVNLAGADFPNLPGIRGVDYTYNSEAGFRYFAGKGLTLIRVPFLWERIQPSLSGPLDRSHLDSLIQNVAWAKANGCKIILDVHNYARYTMNGVTYVMDNLYDGVVRVSTADLIDLWTKLSTEFKADDTVYAYGLMNEPRDMGTADWKKISQAVLLAIRNNGDDKLIMVPGDGWSSAYQWVDNHGPTAWIDDPADHFHYEAHTYFDSDNSGTYQRTYADELAADPQLPIKGSARLKPFVEWCRSNGVQGFLGEFGVPGDDERWNVVLDNFMTALDDAGFEATYWAAGELWGDYPLSVQPTNDFTGDRPQMAILRKHLGSRL